MTKTWVIADTHFGHANILNFKRADGITPLRDFKSVEDMDQCMISRWNERVSAGDRVYHLGDVAINRKFLWMLGQLTGRLVLVKGNHDIFKAKDYLEYFDDIRAYVVQKTKVEGQKLILSHIPIHPESLGRFGVNVHGHLHANKVDDGRYVCVSVEHTDYAPIELHEAYSRASI